MIITTSTLAYVIVTSIIIVKSYLEVSEKNTPAYFILIANATAIKFVSMKIANTLAYYMTVYFPASK